MPQKKAETMPLMDYVETATGICLTLLIYCISTGSAPKEVVRPRRYIYIYWSKQVQGADLGWSWTEHLYCPCRVRYKYI